MGHTRAENLRDLDVELSEIRTLSELKEKSPGVFYFKSKPFLHFHDKDGERWADVRVKDQWVKLKIDFEPGKALRALFLKKVKAAYSEISKTRRGT